MSFVSDFVKRREDCKPVPINQGDHDFVHRDNRWDLWIMSPQYAKAFQAYWNNKGFPLEIYPTWLLKNNMIGKLQYEPLHGTHIWMKDDYELFKQSKIYNEQLHIWCHRLMYEHFVDVAVKRDNSVRRERWYYPNREGFYACELF